MMASGPNETCNVQAVGHDTQTESSGRRWVRLLDGSDQPSADSSVTGSISEPLPDEFCQKSQAVTLIEHEARTRTH
ncbi:MAG: hypothetical protein CBB71_11995 [Rhodopirellula sp. TMED11]|nr:MAG: hypothetical protein CBB71_11995 [Rhodopirellula sp. TMED11]